MTSVQLARLCNLVREVTNRRGIDYALVYEELGEIAELSEVLGEKPPDRGSASEKKKWVRDNLTEVKRKKSFKKAAHFLRWLHHYGATHLAEAIQDDPFLPDLLVPPKTPEQLGAKFVEPSRVEYLTSNGLAGLVRLGTGQEWARIVELKNRIEMRGIGGNIVPQFPLDALVQVQIDPPTDGFVSLINIDDVDRNIQNVFFLDPLMGSSDLVAYAGEELVLPGRTLGLPVAGYKNVRSKLIVCISEVSVFELWGRHLNAGEAFQPTDIQLRKFGRLILGTHLSSRAIATLPYQT